MKTLMLQGTSSHVGKSILTAALCRIFRQDGFKVVPFKSQNMALNSYVTKTGGEMGRAQVVQAEAAGVEPTVEMNPVLLKPTGNSSSQVIVLGKPVGNMSAREYHNGHSLKLLTVIEECLRKLQREFDIVVIEGAGSPAEVNLKAYDIVNMRMAKLAPAPVLLIADIDRGGALASVVGTLELLEPEERDLVKGIIINKFRGDIKLLEPALEFLAQRTGKPVVGVIPHIERLGIEDEDSVSLDDRRGESGGELDIVVLTTPRISNFTDFDSLANEDDVTVRYVRQGDTMGQPDLIILPGSKNTTGDLQYLKETGYAGEIVALAAAGTPVIGICGGYQMLGRKICDPGHSESDLEEVEALGLFDAVTVFAADKVTHQVTAACAGNSFLGIDFSADDLTGYEIHMGRTEFSSPVQSAFNITCRSGEPTARDDGGISPDGLVMGTYIHGIFDNDEFRRAVINAIRKRKGLAPLTTVGNTKLRKEDSYDRLADIVRKNMDMELVYRLMADQ